MISTPKQALEFVREHGIVTMTRGSSRNSLVDAVAGGPVRGSWWGHPKGKLIFRLADYLTDSGEVISAKLLAGKITFIHKSLWPALARVVTDRGWRTQAGRDLSAEAQELMRAVERRGMMRMDRSGMKGRKELESSLLVHSGSVHTEKGSHTTVLTKWSKVFDAQTLAQARKFSLAEALNLLDLAPVP
jgi:hypothetical protein